MFYEGGDDLSTGPTYSADVFYPESDEWETITIDLSAFSGDDNITLYFRNIGYWGQAMYIDNINIAPLFIGIDEIESGITAEVVPNPNQGYFNLGLESTAVCEATIKLVNALGAILEVKTVQLNQGDNTVLFDRTDIANGIYFVDVQSENGKATIPIVIE